MLRIQDWMLITSLIEQAEQDARLQKSPPVVLEAMGGTKRRVQNVKMKAPCALTVAFQEKFHRNEIVAIRTALAYARLWMERGGQELDAQTVAGLEALQAKVIRYVDEMDAAAEMRGWFASSEQETRIVLPGLPNLAEPKK